MQLFGYRKKAKRLLVAVFSDILVELISDYLFLEGILSDECDCEKLSYFRINFISGMDQLMKLKLCVLSGTASEFMASNCF